MRHHARLLLSRVTLLIAIGTFPALAQQPHMGESASSGLWIVHEKMQAERAAMREPFRDCAECPALVAIEPGSVLTSPKDDHGCHWYEETRAVEVTVASPFAVGVFEVTVDEWATCRRGGGCSHDPRESEPGRAHRPVTDVSWEDAQQYVRWLSAKTGERYRLPSESEWRYVASLSKNGTGHGSDRSGPHGVVESVMEWLEEPASPCVRGAPDASRQDDDRRILRGPSDCYHPRSVRSAFRHLVGPRVRDSCVGFRVARDLGGQASPDP